MNSRSLPWVLLALLGTGCSKSCKNDHPYVPYAVGDEAAPSAAHVPPSRDASSAAGPVAVVAPQDATRWRLEGQELVAPPGKTFLLGLVDDFDEDGSKEAIVTATGGTVLYFPTNGRPIEVVTAPLPEDGPSCVAVQRLAKVGRRSVFVELGGDCPSRVTATTRWVGVITVGKTPSVHYSTVVTDPPGAPRLTFEGDGVDRDGDGIDDVALRVSIEGGNPPFEPGPKVTAQLRWFDRPAGLSRDAAEPEGSLHAIAQLAAARAGKAKDASGAASLLHQFRALFSAICVDAGAPRLSSAVVCGPSQALLEAQVAVVRAQASVGDALRATAAFERVGSPPAARTPARLAEAEKQVEQLAKVVMSTSLRAVAAVPAVERGVLPAWGALAFEPGGKLLVRTASGVVRVDPLTGDEAAADVPSWGTAVQGPDGATRWLGAHHNCDGAALRATFGSSEGAGRELALPIVPPLGTRCVQGNAEPAPSVPIAWGPGGLEAFISREPVLISPDLTRASGEVQLLDQPFTFGSPRSPSGHVLVVATQLGLLVMGPEPRLFRARELEGHYLELRDCAVTDDALSVACVRSGRVLVGVWPSGKPD